MYNFTSNNLIEAVLFSKSKIKSYINYRILLYKIKRVAPSYEVLLEIYNFIDQLNFAYFYCLDDSNKLFIKDSRKENVKNNNKSLLYKDNSVTITITLEPDEYISLHIKRYMGYKETKIKFKNGEVVLNNRLEEQLFINCTDIIMDELYKIVKKYRYFRKER